MNKTSISDPRVIFCIHISNLLGSLSLVSLWHLRTKVLLSDVMYTILNQGFIEKVMYQGALLA
jgi:hypothetical protein